MGKMLGLTGYVQNHFDKSVVGEACGSEKQILRMKTWLKITGSAKSRIDKAIFDFIRDDESKCCEEEMKIFKVRREYTK